MPTTLDVPLVLGREANLFWRELAPFPARVNGLLDGLGRCVALALAVRVLE